MSAMFLDLSQVDWGSVGLIFAYFLNFLAVIGVVFVERRSQTSAILWCIVLVILPVVGLVFYIFLGKGPSFGRKKKFLNKYYKDNTYCKEMENQIRLISDRSHFPEELPADVEQSADLIRYNLKGCALISVFILIVPCLN